LLFSQAHARPTACGYDSSFLKKWRLRCLAVVWNRVAFAGNKAIHLGIAELESDRMDSWLAARGLHQVRFSGEFQSKQLSCERFRWAGIKMQLGAYVFVITLI
jgi:hypothetical protein